MLKIFYSEAPEFPSPPLGNMNGYKPLDAGELFCLQILYNLDRK